MAIIPALVSNTSTPADSPHGPTAEGIVKPLPTMIGGRLEAIGRGEAVAPEIHPELARESMVLDVERFSLWYGQKQALFDITLGIPRAKITALIGPSGCGKSTLLRSVNRLNDLIDGVRRTGDMRLNGDSIYARSADVIELRK